MLAFSAGCGAPPEGDLPTLVLGGDLMLARRVEAAFERQGPGALWGDVLPLLRGASLTFVNLECVLADQGEPFQPPRVYSFRAAPGALAALEQAGIDGVTLANNHAMDFGAPALLQTLALLDAAGIAHVGAGANRAAAARPVVLPAGGLRVGFLAYADHFREYAATEVGPGTNFVGVPAAATELEAIRQAIVGLRGQGADLVVFSMHAGQNFVTTVTPAYRDFARAVIEAGADVFHGHSAHVFHGIEIHHGRPILYDTGDLLDDYRLRPAVDNDLQLLFRLTLVPAGVERIELLPLRVRGARVRRAGWIDSWRIGGRIRRLFGELGTPLRWRGDRWVLEIHPPG